MGIKERHERDREAVSRSILDAARELFVSEGYQNVSMRKIAERIEYSPAAIYGYFPCKDDIFFALAEEGFRLLGAPDDDSTDDALRALEPLDRLREIFWHVYEFGLKHPQYFSLMFIDRDVPRISREYERFAFVRAMKANLVARIQSCIDANALPSTVDASAACRMLTMGVLGVSAMRLSDRLGPPAQVDVLARDVLNALLAGLQSGVLLQATDAPCTSEEQQPQATVSSSGVVS
ncbi:MAG: TetR/AcrR family transcriptional regulator [Acidobacteriota bacterium]